MPPNSLLETGRQVSCSSFLQSRPFSAWYPKSTSNLRWNTTSASSGFTVTTYHTTGDANQSRNDNAFCVRITSLATLGHPNTSELALKPTRLNHHEVVPDLRLFSLTSPPLLTMQWCNQVQNKQKNCDYFRSTPAPHILHVATNSQHGID